MTNARSLKRVLNSRASPVWTSYSVVHDTAKVRGKSIRCLLDSGCKSSIVGRSMVPDLHRTRPPYALSIVDGTDLPVVGDMGLHFTTDGHQFAANVCVSPAVDELL